MSILTEKLPSYVTVDGAKYPVNTDFRTWLRFGELIKKADEKSMCDAIILCYKGGKLPPFFFESYKALCDFFTCNKVAGKVPRANEPVFDFTEDAELIFASFMSDYHIDLIKENMHWYTFLALLSGLSPDSPLMRVIAIRSINLSAIKDDKLRAEYRKRQRIYRLKSASDCDSFAERLIKYI